MSLEKLFDSYIQAGIYLKAWSPKTAVIYRRAFTSLQQNLRESTADSPISETSLTKTQLEAWVITMRHKGMSPAGINIYIRAMNAFGCCLTRFAADGGWRDNGRRG